MSTNTLRMVRSPYGAFAVDRGDFDIPSQALRRLAASRTRLPRLRDSRHDPPTTPGFDGRSRARCSTPVARVTPPRGPRMSAPPEVPDVVELAYDVSRRRGFVSF